MPVPTHVPHPVIRLLHYRRRFGWRATLARLLRELRQRASTPAGPAAAIPSAAELIAARFDQLAPLRFFAARSVGRRRLSLITDSINRGSLFGGVGTAMILATLLANRLGADLRVITRTEPAVASNLDHVLQAYGLALQGESQFRFAPAGDAAVELDLFDDELLITTSWWTTAATLAGVAPQRVTYLLQEDERMFYPFGDERLRCEALLRRTDVRFVVNTRLLKDHFIGDGLQHFAEQAISFEPAFPPGVFHPRPRVDASRRRFVFYARPHNARNLFYLGLETIEHALMQGVLDPQVWDIVFVGKDIPDVQLAGGVRPQRLENLDWMAYADLIGQADLGLCLMGTPHPSYPPLDMVASGAVVVSTRHGLKQDLSALSKNLILCDAAHDALVDGLRQAVALVADDRRRMEQFRAGTLSRDWATSLQALIEQLAVMR